MEGIRTVSSLSLAPYLIQLLAENGFKTVSDILETGPLDLARGEWSVVYLNIIHLIEIKIPIESAREIFQIISNSRYIFLEINHCFVEM